MEQLKEIDIGDMEMTESQAERIFFHPQKEPIVEDTACVSWKFCQCHGQCTEQVYLGESMSLMFLHLSWCKGDDEGPVSLSRAVIASICDGIAASPSLTNVTVRNVPADGNDTSVAAELLASAITKSRRLAGISTMLKHREFLRKVQNALLRTQAVLNFEMCFMWNEDSEVARLAFSRTIPWKPLLSQNVPLALWPRIFARSNAWRRGQSHSRFDAVYFLF